MRILITRPAFEADEFAARLRSAGHSVISSPMMCIEFRPSASIDTRGLQALIITSRNALRALERQDRISDLAKVPVYAVGIASADLAHTLGFSQIVTGPAGARELAELIAADARPDAGHLLHLCGDVRAVAIDAALAGRGFTVKTAEVYHAHPANGFAPAASTALAAGALDIVVLMSPRTAQTFALLAANAGLRGPARRLNYACISEPTARALCALDLSAGYVHTPSRPRSAELLELINRISAQKNY